MTNLISSLKVFPDFKSPGVFGMNVWNLVTRNPMRVSNALLIGLTNVATIKFNLKKIFIEWVLFAKIPRQWSLKVYTT